MKRQTAKKICTVNGDISELEMKLSVNRLARDIELYTSFGSNKIVQLNWNEGGDTYICSFRDEQLEEAVKNGDLNPYDWKNSAIRYCLIMGLISLNLHKQVA
jgi:hypothetical protein